MSLVRCSSWHQACRASLLLATAALFACGGGNDQPSPIPPAVVPPATALPAAINLTVPSHVETGSSVQPGSDLGAGTAGLRYAWDFGNGNVASTAQPPAQTYANDGVYAVKLTVTNEVGESHSASAQLLVGQLAKPEENLGCSRPGQRGWCGLPRTFYADVRSVVFVDAAHGWASDERGNVFRTTDAGASWQVIAARLPSGPSTITFTDGSQGWLTIREVTLRSRLFRTTDGGIHWSEVFIDSVTQNSSLSGLQARGNTVLVYSTGGLRVSRDNGLTWRAQPPLAGAVLAPSGEFWGIATGTASTTGRLFRWSETGEAVVPAPLASVTTMASFSFADANNGYALDTRSIVWRTRDGGSTWTATTAAGLFNAGTCPPRSDLPNLTALSSGTLWVSYSATFASGSSASCALRSTDGGASWAAVTGPGNAQAAITPVTDELLVLCCSARYISTDGGVHWIETPGGNSLQRLSDRVFVLQTSGRADGSNWIRTSDGGGSWSPMLSSGISTLTATTSGNGRSFALDRDNLFTLHGRALLQTRNSGKTWSQIFSLPPASNGLGGMHFSSPTSGRLLDYTGMDLYRTTDGGQTWALQRLSQQPVGTFTYGEQQLAFQNDRVGLRSLSTFTVANNATAYHGHLYLTTNGDTWEHVAELTFGIMSIAWGGPSLVLATGYESIARSTDGGRTWTTQRRDNVQLLYSVGFSDPDTAWVVGSPGVVLRSTDAGASWSRVTVPTDKFLTKIHFSDARNGYLAGAEGTVLATTDGGSTWTLQETGIPEDISTIVATSPGVARLVTSQHYIYDTVTGGY